MKKTAFLLTVILQAGFVYSQTTLSLEECYSRAIEVHPVSGDNLLLEGMTMLKLKNHNAFYYPRFDLYAQATYQSDVTSVGVSFPGIDIPKPANDQYKIAMDITQVIYDGGVTKSRKDLEKQQLETAVKQTEVTLHQLKEMVNSVFFSVLLLQEQEKILGLMTEVLDERVSVARSAVRNGIMMESDLLSLLAEQLKLKQQVAEVSINKETGFIVLAELLDMEFDEGTELLVPVVDINRNSEISRPEIELFESQISQFSLTGDIIRSSRRPKLYAFSQVGYGRPGLNMLSDEFDPFYVVGARVSWNPFDWKQSKRERELLLLQQDQVTNQMEAFTRTVNIELERTQSEMKKFEKLMTMDEAIITMRNQIVQSSTSKLDNGVINSADFISDLNAEKQARIEKEIHRMKWLKAQADYAVKKGH